MCPRARVYALEEEKISCPCWDSNSGSSSQYANYAVLISNTLDCIYLLIHVFILLFIYRTWDSLVTIATRYGLEGWGFEPRWGREFSQPVRTAPTLTQPPLQWVLGLCPRGRVVATWC
jgi:hypothetical protein